MIERAAWLLFCSMALTACGGSGQPSPAEPSADPRLARLEARLRLAHGFREPDEVRRVVSELREAAAKTERRTLAEAIHYPFMTYAGGTPVGRYHTPAEVLADFDTLFPEYVLEALRDARYEDLFVRDQGAMIGRGQVWLGQFEEGVRIKALNATR